MNNKIYVFLITFLFNVMVCSASPSGEHVKINSTGTTDLSGIFGKNHVLVKFTTHEVDIGNPSGDRPSKLLSSCTYSRFPCSAVDLVELFVNDISLFVPRSVYSDLADISEVNLHQKKKDQFFISILGGDASESYSVEITFNKNSVTQRALIGNEAKQILQKTIYYPPPTMD